MTSWDKNLRLILRFRFEPVDGIAGTIRWVWRSYDSAGNLVSESASSFEMLTEATEDARLHGYIEPR